MVCEICGTGIQERDVKFRTETGYEHDECHRGLSWIVDNQETARRIIDGVDKGQRVD